MKINDELISKIEKSFGFPLYDWQKTYLKGETCYIPIKRKNGKTFAYILRLLLSDGKPLKTRELSKHADILLDSWKYRDWFAREVMHINEILNENRIETNLEE